MALIRLRVCAGLAEALLVAQTTLLEISCQGSNFVKKLYVQINEFSVMSERVPVFLG